MEEQKKMTMDMFADMVKEVAEMHLGEDYEIRVERIWKNNDQYLTALLVGEADEGIARTIYLDDFYERFQSGEAVERLYCEILLQCGRNCVSLDFDREEFLSFEKIKERICFKLVSAEYNKKFLNYVPHLRLHDLAVIFHVVVAMDEISTSSTVVKYWMQKRWGVGMQELYRCAMANTQRMFQVSMEEMGTYLRTRLEEGIVEEDEMQIRECLEEKKTIPMYIVTNRQRTNGAGVLLYPGLMKKFAEFVGTDIYILPSSVHETLWIPAYGNIDVEELKQTVYMVNREAVSLTERLSDSVYFYDHKADRLEIV